MNNIDNATSKSCKWWIYMRQIYLILQNASISATTVKCWHTYISRTCCQSIHHPYCWYIFRIGEYLLHLFARSIIIPLEQGQALTLHSFIWSLKHPTYDHWAANHTNSKNIWYAIIFRSANARAILVKSQLHADYMLTAKLRHVIEYDSILFQLQPLQ